MAVQVGIPGYQPRMRLEAPSSVYFPPQNISVSSASEPLAAPQSVLRSLGPAVVPGIAPPSKSINANASSTPAVSLGSCDGRRMRSKTVTRRTVDYNASLINYVQVSRHLIF